VENAVFIARELINIKSTRVSVYIYLFFITHL
jgi:hypothetical protein